LRTQLAFGEKRERTLEAQVDTLAKQLAAASAQLDVQSCGEKSAFKRQWRGPLAFLPALELPRLSVTSKHFAELLNDDAVWHDVVDHQAVELACQNHKASLIARHSGKQLADCKAKWANVSKACVDAVTPLLEIATTQLPSLEGKLKESRSKLETANVDLLMLQWKLDGALKDIVKWTISASCLSSIGWYGSIKSQTFNVRGASGHLELFPWGNRNAQKGRSSLFMHMGCGVRVRARVFFDNVQWDTLNHQYGKKKPGWGWDSCLPVDKRGVVIQVEFDVVDVPSMDRFHILEDADFGQD